MSVMLLVTLAGALSAWLYARARRWPDAVLAMLAALALAGLLGDFKTPAPPLREVAIDPQADVIDLRSAAAVSVSGNGLSAARWRDLPARPLRWQAPGASALELDFPRSVPPGGVFTLEARLGARTGLRLQLLAENGQLLAESTGRLQWIAAGAGERLLRARLLDPKGRLLAQGPVPLRVDSGARLRVQGRFSAPSFDKRALRLLLESSHALLDWQVTLAPGVVRADAPASDTRVTSPDLIVADARWLDRLPAERRGALLGEVARGTRLLVLGAGASASAFWSDWAELAPAGQQAWTASRPIATRIHGAGRIGWLSAADWHRHAIGNPALLAQWWQGVIDQLGVTRAEPVAWLEPPAMPLAGERLEVCAYGATGTVEFPQLGQTLAWQRRAERADASCVAVWPAQAGWLQVRSQGQSTRIYVYAADDWPGWQAALKRAATRRYALRTPEPAAAREERIPAWPFAGVFALSMLGLWWRERGAPVSMAQATRADPASSF